MRETPKVKKESSEFEKKVAKAWREKYRVDEELKGGEG